MGRGTFWVQSATITKYTASTAGTYGSKESWVTGSTVTCSIQPAPYSKSEQNDKQTFITFWDMECAYGTNIAQKDRVTFGSTIFDVISVHDPLNRHDCLKVRLRTRE